MVGPGHAIPYKPGMLSWTGRLRARTSAYATAGLMTLAVGCVLPANASAGAAGIHLIKHVVVIMQENHSFDNYFGTFPGADGIPGLAGHPGRVPCIPDPNRGGLRPALSRHAPVRRRRPALPGSALADIDRGKMDGFVGQAEGTTPDTKTLGCVANAEPPVNQRPPIGDHCLDVMGYYNGGEIPNYWTYAHDFVLQDHMFEPAKAWSEVSHLYMVSGWSAAVQDANKPFTCVADNQFPEYDKELGALRRPARTRRGGPVQRRHGLATPSTDQQPPIYGWTDITYLLHKHHVSWRYYIQQGTEPDCDSGAMSCKPIARP